MNTTKRQDPFGDGDIPDRLLDDISNTLDDALTKFDDCLREAREQGMSALVVLTYYDPLTGATSMSANFKGDRYALIGGLEAWKARRMREE